MHRRPDEKRDNWLLIKSRRRRGARGRATRTFSSRNQRSVATGRTMDEIAQGKAQSEGLASKRRRSKPAPAKPAAKTTAKAKRSKDSEHCNDPRAGPPLRPDGALPDFVEPCLATLSDKAPDSGNWMHEIKFDGYRLQARIERRQGQAADPQRSRLDRRSSRPSRRRSPSCRPKPR